ncbi:MAG: YfcE family phosphodiesterase [Clostridia bacterium]|nr:YfcE family phosphodiesterase [Clostridia bacterium]
MRILVFSDSHNSDTNMREVLRRNQTSFDLCIHLGDGCYEFEALGRLYYPIPFVTVNGNGEDWAGHKRVKETVLDLDGVRIMVTHGHLYNVKYGTTNLEYNAVEKECDIVLYGHTHIPDNRCLPDVMGRKLYIFNPGSISRPPIGRKPSFGVVEITKSGIVLNCAEV